MPRSDDGWFQGPIFYYKIIDTVKEEIWAVAKVYPDTSPIFPAELQVRMVRITPAEFETYVAFGIDQCTEFSRVISKNVANPDGTFSTVMWEVE